MKIGSVVDAVTGVFDTVTLDAFDLNGDKKLMKKQRKAIEDQQRKSAQQEEKEKKKQKDAEINLYEGMRQGNLGLLNVKKNQTIG